MWKTGLNIELSPGDDMETLVLKHILLTLACFLFVYFAAFALKIDMEKFCSLSQPIYFSLTWK